MKESREKRGIPQNMVDWYSPKQLVLTGLEVLLSTLLRDRLDRRVTDAASEPPLYYDYSECAKDDEFWWDFVADVGDGYNSTYEVARQMARAQLKVAVEKQPGADGPQVLHRGQFVLMGGDEVYPTATDKEYRNRMMRPYQDAFEAEPTCTGNSMPQTETTAEVAAPLVLARPEPCEDGSERCRPDAYAIPGNHDWYDGLSSFRRVFCKGRVVGGLQTRQRRSYFALKLPYDWWILALDFQLTGHLDDPQRQYFDKVIAKLSGGDKVILCSANPCWEAPEGGGRREREEDLYYNCRKEFQELENRISEQDAEARLWIAGDLHYYRRYSYTENKSGQGEVLGHMVTCGGGGAFLHPTHTRGKADVPVPYREQWLNERACYPSRGRSRFLTIWHFLQELFDPFSSAGVGLIAMMMYLLMGWHLVFGLNTDSPIEYYLIHPTAIFWLATTFFACYMLTDPSFVAWRRLVSASLHWLLHLSVLLLLSWLLLHHFRESMNSIFEFVSPGSDQPGADGHVHVDERRVLIVVTIVTLGGFILGRIAFTFYMTMLCLVRNTQGNNLFSVFRIEDYKSFLRIRIRKDRLDAYAIGIDEVGRYKRRLRSGLKDLEPAPVKIVDHFSMPPESPEER